MTAGRSFGTESFQSSHALGSSHLPPAISSPSSWRLAPRRTSSNVKSKPPRCHRANSGTVKELITHLCSSNGLLLARHGAVVEVVEGRDAVGLGPHTDCAATGDVRVIQLDVALVVQRHRDVRARELDTQRVPGSAGDRRIDVLDG